MVRIIIALLAILIMAGPAFAKDIDLPAPFAENQPIYQLLQARSSVNLNDKLSNREISLEHASSLLWAASGLNRPERGWVVPVAYGNAPAPYWRVYALHKSGVYLYNWKANRLEQISGADVRQRIFSQPIPSMASFILIFVEDGDVLEDIKNMTSNRYNNLDLGAIALGAISQDIYLSAETLNMYTRLMVSIKSDVAGPLLELGKNDRLLGYMPVWYKN